MEKINSTRVILGGIVGGIVGYVTDFVVNGIFFKDFWSALVAKGLSKPPSMNGYVSEFVVVFVTALLGTYVYALARPRLGGSARSGLRVAVLAGLLVAVPSGAGTIIWSANAQQIGWAMIVGGFLVTTVATFFGAWVYKE